MSKEETVEIQIPKDTADHIRRLEWFRFYNSLDEFVVEAIRGLLIKLKGAETK